MAQDVIFVILVTLLLGHKNVANGLIIRHNCGEHKNTVGNRCSSLLQNLGQLDHFINLTFEGHDV